MIARTAAWLGGADASDDAMLFGAVSNGLLCFMCLGVLVDGSTLIRVVAAWLAVSQRLVTPC